MPKAPFLSYSRIFYFGHACPKLSLVLISRLAGKRTTQNLKTYAILVYGHVDILWTYERKYIDFGLIVLL